MKVTLKLGDISGERADAIVNAANSSLLGGGGVDGAIHRRGGPAILTECLELRKTRYTDGLPAGQAVATTAGDLDVRWVIHTVGPVYSSREDRSAVLVSCYEQSLRIADELGARTVAFPAVSAGVYGWPAESAARIAITTVSRTPSQLEEARFVLFTEDMLATFRAVLDSLGSSSLHHTFGPPGWRGTDRRGRRFGVPGSAWRVSARARPGSRTSRPARGRGT
jgi:O-acetyl-ADP-ribose deacetylase